MLIDKAEAVFKAGDGGNGKVSFRRNRKGPDGGNGGDGGNLYIRSENNLFLLNQFSREVDFEAEAGVPGGTNGRTGHNGGDLEIALPVGTSIINKKSGQLIHEFTTVGEKILLCKGGKGGRGNWEFRNSLETTPRYAEKGTKGEKVEAILTLKLIADFGLIGLPNAGKSSLLNELTRAKAKVANYAFTTLEPNLGVLNDKVLADIPGLIEGAAEGRGLGIGFLKHIEKVDVIIHCISFESADLLTDYETVRNELGKFNPGLLGKKEVVLLTKTDLLREDKIDTLVNKLKKVSRNVLPVSIHDLDSLKRVKDKLEHF